MLPPQTADDYCLLELLGQGSYATVYKARHKVTGEVVAVKAVTRPRRQDGAELPDEITIAASMHHPYIVRLHSFWQEGEAYHLVMELCTGGDLLAYVRLHLTEMLHQDPTHDSGLRSDTILPLLFPMLISLEFLHSHCVVHRDIKPDNFVFVDEGPGAILKMIDFGLSCRLDHGKTLHRLGGTMAYLAPEVFRRDYAHKADIWGVGVTAHCLSTNLLPFDGTATGCYTTDIQAGAFVNANNAWRPHPANFRRLVYDLMTVDQFDRPTATKALAMLAQFESPAEQRNPSNAEQTMAMLGKKALHCQTQKRLMRL